MISQLSCLSGQDRQVKDSCEKFPPAGDQALNDSSFQGNNRGGYFEKFLTPTPAKPEGAQSWFFTMRTLRISRSKLCENKVLVLLL